MKRSEKIENLHSLAVRKSEGFTVTDMLAAGVGHSRGDCRTTVRKFRAAAAFIEDGVTLVCTPAGDNREWLYSLAGDHEAAQPWIENRMRDTETRLDTIHNVAAAVVALSDARTVGGKRARMVEMGLRHLLEQLDAVS